MGLKDRRRAIEQPIPEETVRTNLDIETSVQIAEEEPGHDVVNEFKTAELKEEKVITNEVDKEEISPPTKKKVYQDVWLSGHSVECNDFRAICKKNNWTMKNVLTGIISKWNQANYNI